MIMKMQFKRFTAIVLTVLLLFGLLPITVNAEDVASYSISYKQSSITGPSEATAGATVTVTVDTPAGKKVDKLIINSAPVDYEQAGENKYSFTMPGMPVLLSVSFTDNYHSITFTTNEGGAVSADKTGYLSGETVILTVIPDDADYYLTDINAKHTENGIEKSIELTQDPYDNSKYSFAMPDNDVIVNSMFSSVLWGRLQEQINSSNSDTIVLSKNIYANEDDNTLNVPKNTTVTIDLNGHILSRDISDPQKGSGVFSVDGSLTVTDSSEGSTGTMTGADKSYAVSVKPYASFVLNKGTVSGVYVGPASSFEMNGGVITNNGVHVSSLGNEYIFYGALFVMNDGEIRDNKGTGVYVDTASLDHRASEFIMHGGSISGNKGGGVYAEYSGVYGCGIINIDGGSITDNGKFGVNGGGSISNCTISGNNGNGVSIYDGYISNCTISGKNGYGAVLCISSIENCTVCDNEKDGIAINDYTESTNYSGSSFISGCTVFNNKGCGAAVSCPTPGEIGIYDSEFYNNRDGILGDGQVEITDCTITGNTGSGFSFYGNLTLSGTIIVTGNGSDFIPCEIPIKISKYFSANSQIGVNCYGESPCPFTSGFSSFADLDIFYSNDPKYAVVPNSDGELIIVPSRSITVTAGENGAASASVLNTGEGKTVLLTATPDDGYRLKEWQVISGEVSIENNSFIMPAEDVEIHAVFERVYRVITDGNVNVFRYGENHEAVYLTEAAEGDELWIEIKSDSDPPEGMYFTKEFSVDGKSLGSSGMEPFTSFINKFTMPAKDVSVSAGTAEKKALTLNLYGEKPYELPYQADVQLNLDDRISKSYDENDYSTLIDLNDSGIPDIRIYEITESSGEGTAATIKCYAARTKNADAEGSFTLTYSKNTDSYSPIIIVLPPNIPGDTNGDGVFNIRDITNIQRHLANYLVLTGAAFKAADWNHDGKITIEDATIMQMYLAEFDVTWG